ncbi:putative pyrroloquinoline-quinone binding quinoprotein [Murinocardiopsis flavida]|uniref:Putative pyrroloquinoline-quinone binding quinoprotein n=1 Tax=Murinocardiopsis flavida TaxID=645275 RepID=A0A2P8CCA6_9ACTN|nr:PQQ-binding-like beta-propeller repeat protein [Murinocardiopsis flavida]PSK82600.1 putative pyrroloquinoline-quinone binding quinoprotein [Murinocardiopsis flavida]
MPDTSEAPPEQESGPAAHTVTRIVLLAAAGACLLLLAAWCARPDPVADPPAREPIPPKLGTLPGFTEPGKGSAAERGSPQHRELWDDTTKGVPEVVRSARFRGDAVALIDGDRGLGVAAADTGRTAWSIAEDAELTGGGGAQYRHSSSSGSPLLTEAGTGWSALVEYVQDSPPGDTEHTASGIAALSGADGSVRWKARIDDDLPALESGGYHLMAMEAGTEVAVGTVASGETGRASREARSVAIDAATGEERWRKKGLWASAVAGDTVLMQDAREADLDATPEKSLNGGGSLVGVDAETGDVTWSLADRYGRAHAAATAGDTALVVAETASDNGAEEPDSAEFLIIDARTGKVLVEFPEDGRPECASDDVDVIACTVDLGGKGFRQVATWRAADREGTVSAHVATGSVLHGAWNGALIAHSGRRDGTAIALDPAGTTIAKDLQGQFLAGSDTHTLFATYATGSTDPGYQVYRTAR